jgi:hypothetical protein
LRVCNPNLRDMRECFTNECTWIITNPRDVYAMERCHNSSRPLDHLRSRACRNLLTWSLWGGHLVDWHERVASPHSFSSTLLHILIQNLSVGTLISHVYVRCYEPWSNTLNVLPACLYKPLLERTINTTDKTVWGTVSISASILLHRRMECVERCFFVVIWWLRQHFTIYVHWMTF